MTRRKGKPDDRGGTSLNDRTAPEWMDSTGEHGPLTVLLMTPAHLEGKLPTNPFTIARSVKEQIGAITAAYRDKDGHLVIKLNQATCIVTCHTVDELSDEELAEELADQGVIHVHRFGRKGGRSATMSVTFRGTVVPRDIHFGFDRCATREFKQAPMQCYRCYDFGHTKPQCSAEELCRNCSKAHTIEKDSDGKTICSAAPSCKHCNGAHSPTSRMCPKYVEEEEINEIRTKEDKSAREARRLFHERKKLKKELEETKHTLKKALTKIASFKQARAAERKQNEENQQALKKAAAQTDGSNLEKTPAKPNSGSELDMEVTEETNKRPRPESSPSESSDDDENDDDDENYDDDEDEDSEDSQKNAPAAPTKIVNEKAPAAPIKAAKEPPKQTKKPATTETTLKPNNAKGKPNPKTTKKPKLGSGQADSAPNNNKNTRKQ
ncbi:eukaryotic translation initiation factor 5B-like [Culex quinquefasciatus]|uniref:eukaryotic translation initiation factor 5B-like n=1 Tax=Culex quinquefasciatus TaxID=7176 RepID=UPI0018E2E1F9|nr:eukaryotic translation initiation factor 5B-like [Culex quinquefasciatus]